MKEDLKHECFVNDQMRVVGVKASFYGSPLEECLDWWREAGGTTISKKGRDNLKDTTFVVNDAGRKHNGLAKLSQLMLARYSKIEFYLDPPTSRIEYTLHRMNIVPLTISNKLGLHHDVTYPP